MSYYVLKHSAKGTTWGEHKYIRKEGNRYIYPEDVKKSANDNIEKQKELNEENTKNDTRYEKALNDYLKTISKDLNVYTITEYEHDRLYENDPKYKELSDLFDEEYYRTSKAKSDAKMEKQDYINKASENKRNRILSEARDAVTKVKNEKEGNRYIYPEDVKKNANDNIEKQKELNEENTENGTRYLKALNDYLKTISKDLNEYNLTEYERNRLYENDPKYKELSDLYAEKRYNYFLEKNRQDILSEAKRAADSHREDPDVVRQNRIIAYANTLKNVSDEELNNRLKRLDDLRANKQTYTQYNIDMLKDAINKELSRRHDSRAKQAAAEKEEHDSRAAQAAAEKETYLKRAENKKKVENKRDRLEYVRNARKTRNRDKKYVVDTEDGGAFVTRNREKAVQVRNEVKQNKLKREDPIKYYLQRRKSKRK